MGEEAWQVILVPTLGTKEAVAISGFPETPAPDVVLTGESFMPESVGQPGIPLTGLLERTLNRMELKYLRESEEAFFTISECDSGSLSVWFLVVGDERNILRIICTDNRRIPKRHWQRTFARCNAYHANFRFGRVYLAIEEGQSEGLLRFDAQLLVPEGVSEAVLQHFIYANLVCAHQFFGKPGGGTGRIAGGDQPTPPRKRLPAAGQKRKSRNPGCIRD